MLKKGMKFKSKNDGFFYITEDRGWSDVSIIFESGYESKATRNQIKEGKVKDRFKRNYYGIGFIGGTKYKTKGKNSMAYHRWRHMLARCYDKDTQSKMKTYIGCSVCDEWHNYQNYADWFYSNMIEGFDVDKDILIDGNRIYSPSTCKLVSHQENTEKATAKEYILKSPKGDYVKIYNLLKFCKTNGLTAQNIHKVIKGVRKHHKGWSL